MVAVPEVPAYELAVQAHMVKANYREQTFQIQEDAEVGYDRHILVRVLAREYVRVLDLAKWQRILTSHRGDESVNGMTSC